MAFQYQAQPLQILEPGQMNPFNQAVHSGLDTFQQGMKAGYLPKQLQEDLLQKQLANKIAGVEAQYAEPKTIQELLKQKLSNQILGVQSEYARPFAEQDLLKAQQFNKYYGPDIQSQIGLRNAQTSHYPFLNKLSEMQANAIPSEISSREANTQKTLGMLPLEIEKQRLENQYYPELTKSRISSEEALSKLRSQGGPSMGVGQKALVGFKNQIAFEHPDWDENKVDQVASAYLSNNDTLQNGEKLPPLSGISETQRAQIQRMNSTIAVQNQAANMNILSSDLKDIDLTPLKKFAGLKGRLDYGKYVAKMAAGGDVPQEFRDYESFKNVTSNFAMDALRKGFGTSVVPGYVYATLGAASNPASKFWHDPEQVERNFKETRDWIDKNAKKLSDISTKGLSATLNKNEKVPSNNKPVSQMTTEEIQSELNSMRKK